MSQAPTIDCVVDPAGPDEASSALRARHAAERDRALRGVAPTRSGVRMSHAEPSRAEIEQSYRERLTALAADINPESDTVNCMVYSLLREAIFAGVLAPGERLRQEALAGAIGVSRVPIRSALHRLCADELVSFPPHQSARVATLSCLELDEIYGMRQVLELEALHRSMQNMSQDRLSRLLDLGRSLDKQATGPAVTAARQRFYREVYDDGSSPRLISLIEQLRSRVGVYWTHASTRRGHATLLRHVAAGDPLAAEQWLRGHLAESQELVRSVVLETASA